jgi:hypothetical protein
MDHSKYFRIYEWKKRRNPKLSWSTMTSMYNKVTTHSNPFPNCNLCLHITDQREKGHQQRRVKDTLGTIWWGPRSGGHPNPNNPNPIIIKWYNGSSFPDTYYKTCYMWVLRKYCKTFLILFEQSVACVSLQHQIMLYILGYKNPRWATIIRW